MTIPFHLEDLSHGYGHSMRPHSPTFNAVGGDGIPKDPNYTPAVIHAHCLRVYGGKGTPAPTSSKGERG